LPPGCFRKRFQLGKNAFLAGCPNHSGAGTAINEIEQGWNGFDPIPPAEIGIVVGVDPGDFHASGAHGHNFVKNRPENLERVTPRSQEPHQDGLLRLDHFRKEVRFADLDDDMALAEDFLVEVVGRVVAERRAELATLERDLAPLERVQKPFPRVRYEEALALLAADGKPLAFGDDFGGDEETVISARFDRPVIVHRYPTDLKAFYFKHDPKDSSVALNMDMLAPEGYGEIVGGGQREDDLAKLEAAIERHKLPPLAFEWYLDLRRYGTFPHAGFGLGIERTVAWICGLPHVRETIPFPRMLNRLSP